MTSKTLLIEATGSNGNGNVVFSQTTSYLARVVRELPRFPTTPTTGHAASDTTADAPLEDAAAQRQRAEAEAAAARCRNSITIYCKDSASGGVVPNVSPEPN